MKTPPWLSHLRTWRGLPVPAINLWGVDTEIGPDVRYDVWVRGRAVFVDDADQDIPDFTRQNMQRQRESMICGLCQVCWRHVPWSRRYMVIAGLSTQTVQLGGTAVTVVTEPWLDQRCAEFAVSTCPALIRRHSEDGLRIVQVRERDTTLIVSKGWVEGPLEDLTRANPVIMWVKASLKGWTEL